MNSRIAILTPDNELIAVAESLPIHVLHGPDIMARTMQENHPELKRGDAYLHNSPYRGLCGDKLPRARFELVERCGHPIMIEQPEVLNAALARFLDSVE